VTGLVVLLLGILAILNQLNGFVWSVYCQPRVRSTFEIPTKSNEPSYKSIENIQDTNYDGLGFASENVVREFYSRLTTPKPSKLCSHPSLVISYRAGRKVGLALESMATWMKGYECLIMIITQDKRLLIETAKKSGLYRPDMVVVQSKCMGGRSNPFFLCRMDEEISMLTKWRNQFANSLRWIIRTDDDYYLNLPTTFRFLETLSSRNVSNAISLIANNIEPLRPDHWQLRWSQGYRIWSIGVIERLMKRPIDTPYCHSHAFPDDSCMARHLLRVEGVLQEILPNTESQYSSNSDDYPYHNLSLMNEQLMFPSFGFYSTRANKFSNHMLEQALNIGFEEFRDRIDVNFCWDKASTAQLKMMDKYILKDGIANNKTGVIPALQFGDNVKSDIALSWCGYPISEQSSSEFVNRCSPPCKTMGDRVFMPRYRGRSAQTKLSTRKNELRKVAVRSCCLSLPVNQKSKRDHGGCGYRVPESYCENSIDNVMQENIQRQLALGLVKRLPNT